MLFLHGKWPWILSLARTFFRNYSMTTSLVYVDLHYKVPLEILTWKVSFSTSSVFQVYKISLGTRVAFMIVFAFIAFKFLKEKRKGKKKLAVKSL